MKETIRPLSKKVVYISKLNLETKAQGKILKLKTETKTICDRKGQISKIIETP